MPAHSQDEFLKELLSDFRAEAAEHIALVADGLLSLEQSGNAIPDKAIIEKIYRETHSLKGAARAVNFTGTEILCQNIETIFSAVKNGKSGMIPEIYDAIYSALGALRSILIEFDISGKEKKPANFQQIIKSLGYVNSIISEKENSAENNIADNSTHKSDSFYAGNLIHDSEEVQVNEVIQPAKKVNESDYIRIPVQKLNKILSQSEELISIKNTIDYYWETLNPLLTKFDESSLSDVVDDLSRFRRIASLMIDDVIHGVKSSLLTPISVLTQMIPLLVRDLSKEMNKKISVKITGEHNEIDRRILEGLKDPIIHLIRNCVDHGIESPEERIKAGKSSEGNINIKISNASDTSIVIEISYDGRGIDGDKIAKSALKKGLIDSDVYNSLKESDKINLIFNSGVSTSDIITEVSGRGLGMAIVAEKISKLEGDITLSTEMGKGTTFVIKLPQSIATFRGIIIKSGGNKFIIPSFSLEKSIALRSDLIKSYGSMSVINFRGSTIGIMSLCQGMGIENRKRYRNQESVIPTLVLKSGNKKIAFTVDEVYGENECIVKSLGTQLRHVRKIVGVTLTGNGVITPIINVDELIEDIQSTGRSGDLLKPGGEAENNKSVKKVLVVEDSITVRNMLKTIVEMEGYDVTIAVDGEDAFNILQKEKVDLVVTDIEMPNMNGFDLTSRIRATGKLKHLPVILVTSLETRADMERGLSVGANAYIVKGKFEKSNLGETIKRLI